MARIDTLELRLNDRCPLCGSPERHRRGLRGPSTHALARSFDASPELRRRLEEITVYDCRACRLIYCSPQPVYDQSAASVIYDEAYCDRHREMSSQATRARIEAHRRWLQETAVALRLAEDLRVTTLDVGAGLGDLVRASCDLGWSAHGIDLSTTACRLARQLNDVDIWPTSLFDEALSGSRFLLITCCGILEHVPDPLAFMQRAAVLLAPGGGIFIDVPNERAVVLTLANLLKRPGHTVNLAPAADPYHIFGFGPSTIAQLARQLDLEIVYLRDTAVTLPLPPRPTLYQRMLVRGMNLVDQIGHAMFRSGSEMQVLLRRRGA